nr:DNA ligase [Mimivirus sp.]
MKNDNEKICTFKILNNNDKNGKSHNSNSKNLKNTNSFISFDNCEHKVYYVHDNGHRPFQVTISKNKKSAKIIIHKYEYESDSDNDLDSDNNLDSDNDLDSDYDLDSKHYKTFVIEIDKFLGYWYGYDTSIDQMHGNTILIKLAVNKYIFIGSEIYKFKTDSDEIIDYVSPVGNSDVPYPVAYGTQFVYFMDDKEKVKKSNFQLDISPVNAEDIFVEFDKMLPNKIIDYTPDTTLIEERQI